MAEPRLLGSSLTSMAYSPPYPLLRRLWGFMNPDLADWPETLPGINIRAGLARVQGDVALFLTLIDKFTVRYGAVEDDLLLDIQRSDWQGAERFVHTLKGLAGNLEAHRLVEAANVLEQSIVRKQREECIKHYNELNHALIELLSSINTIQSFSCSGIKLSKGTLNAGDIPSLIDELTEHLQSRNFAALACARKLSASFENSEQLRELVVSVEALDYTVASEQLNSLKIQLL